jgi:hypothetical protein
MGARLVVLTYQNMGAGIHSQEIKVRWLEGFRTRFGEVPVIECKDSES